MRHSLLLLCCAMLLAGCSGGDQPQVSAPQTTNDLQTVKAEPATVARELRFDGVVEAVNQATVAAQTSGRILELPFDVGDYVRQGDVIVRITATEQKAQASGAEANLKSAEAELKQARKQFDRTNDLMQRKLVAAADFDHAKTNLDSATAKANAAKEALAQATEHAGYTEIRAPYSGLVVKRHVDVGETVSVGTPLMTGLSLAQLRVVVQIPQQHLATVREFRRARVALSKGRWVQATTLRISPSAEPGSHTFRVLATLPDDALDANKPTVFPGALVKVAFLAENQQQLLVPVATLVQRGELTALYIIDDNGAIEFRYVRVGSPNANGQMPVLAGLTAGDRVALDPLAAGRLYRQRAETTRE